jgi:hypothetical protein
MDHLAFEPSLILPSVRHLHVWGRATEAEALVLCCGLVQMGYKHRLAEVFSHAGSKIGGPYFSTCMAAVLRSGGITLAR